MIIAAAPGGVTSNILTAFARGDVALSISLTAVISLLSVITIPAVVVFSYAQLIGGEAGDVSVASTAISVFAIVTVPVLIGLAVRRCAEGFAIRLEPIARQVSARLFVLVLAGAIFQERANIVTYFAQAGLITLVLNLVMMVLAYVIARVFASGPQQRVTISLECGLQNGTLAIAVATLLFDGGLATVVPAATYSLIMFATALIYIVDPAPLKRELRASHQAAASTPAIALELGTMHDPSARRRQNGSRRCMVTRLSHISRSPACHAMAVGQVVLECSGPRAGPAGRRFARYPSPTIQACRRRPRKESGPCPCPDACG